MPAVSTPDNLLQEALDLAEIYGTGYMAIKAGATTVNRSILERRIQMARLKGMKPTVKKDAPRVYTRQRIGKMHVVIPDAQVSPGVKTDHLEHIGNYLVEKQPDVIICIGDFADIPSLSVYDRGKLKAEGKRYMEDLKCARAAMGRLMKPIEDYNRTAKEKYEPRKVFTMGNHEFRADRYAEDHPELEGFISSGQLGYQDWGWEVIPYLQPIKIDGIEYCHYFTSGVMGRPVSSAAALLRERQCSATMGHVQHTDIAFHKKTRNIAMFCGTAYTHDESYLGPQGNCQRRQIIIKHEVEDGTYDPMFASLRFLAKAYS